MSRPRLLLAALLSSLLGAWLMLLTGRLVGSTPTPSPVYSLAVLHTLVERAPAHWLGRTVVVRALAEPCPWWGAAARLRHCAGQPLVLIWTATDAPTEPLPLVQPTPSPLWAVLGRLPWLGDWLPQPVPVDRFVLARYHLRLLALPACIGAHCYAAELLGVEPQIRDGG